MLHLICSSVKPGNSPFKVRVKKCHLSKVSFFFDTVYRSIKMFCLAKKYGKSCKIKRFRKNFSSLTYNVLAFYSRCFINKLYFLIVQSYHNMSVENRHGSFLLVLKKRGKILKEYMNSYLLYTTDFHQGVAEYALFSVFYANTFMT